MRDLSLPFPPIHQGVTASSSLRTVQCTGHTCAGSLPSPDSTLRITAGSSHEIWQMCPPYKISLPLLQQPPFPTAQATQPDSYQYWFQQSCREDGWINTEGRRQKKRNQGPHKVAYYPQEQESNLPAIRTSFCILLWRGAICVPKDWERALHIYFKSHTNVSKCPELVWQSAPFFPPLIFLVCSKHFWSFSYHAVQK